MAKSDALIKLGVDIPKSTANINQAIKELENKANKMKVQIELDNTKVNSINKQIDKIGENNKIDLKLNTEGVTKQVNAIAKQFNSSGADAGQKFLNSFVSSLKNAKGVNFAKIVNIDGVSNFDKTLKNLKDSLKSLNGVSDVNFKTNYDMATSSLKDFTAQVKLTNGETQKLTYTLNKVGDGFVLNKNIAGSDFGIGAIEKAVNKYKTMMSEFKKSYGGLTGLKDTTAAVDQLIAGLERGDVSVEQVAKAFSDLKVSANGIAENLRPVGSSLNVVTNALNNTRDFPNVIKKLSIEFNSLKNQPKELGNTLSTLTEKVANLKKIELQSGVNESWANEYRQINLLIDEATASLKSLRQEQTAINISGLDKTQEEVNRLRVNFDKLHSTITSSQMLNFNPKIGSDFSYIASQAISLEGELKNLKNQMYEVSRNGGDTSALVGKYTKLKEEVAKCSNQYKTFKAQVDSATNSMNFQNRQAVQISRIESYMKTNTKAVKQYGDEMKYILNLTRNAKSGIELTDINTQWKQLTNQIRVSGQEGKTFVDTFKQHFGQLSGYLSVTTVFFQVTNKIKDMASAVVAVDTSMGNLKKVTVATDSEFNNFFDRAKGSAVELGAALTDIIDATAEFSRLGYSLSESANLGEVATLYKNVGDGLSAEDASQSIISTMKAFNIEAENAIKIVDIYNEVGNNFAISSSGIGEAMQRSAASLAEANNTIEESVALTVAANNVIQNPEKVGNMWKTVSMRIRGAEAELEEAGLETEGMVKNVAKLQNMIKRMTGFDILEIDQQTFKSTYDIILGIGEAWEDLADIDQAALLEALAGKQQGNALAAALTNIKDMQAAYESATNSAGSAMKEQENYTKTIQYTLDQLTAKFQILATNSLDSGIVKGLAELASGLLTVVDNFGLVNTAITAFSTVAGLRGVNIFGKILSGANSASNSVGTLISGFKQLASVIKVDGFKGLKNITPISKTDCDMIMQYNLALKEGFTAGEAFELSMTDASASAQKLVKNSNGAAVSQTTLQNAMKSTGAAAKAMSIATNLAYGALNLIVSVAIIKGIELIGNVFNNTSSSVERAKEAIEAYNESISELETLNSELENTKTKLEEIQSKGKIELTDATELANLKRRTEELENQRIILEDIANSNAREKAQAVSNALNDSGRLDNKIKEAERLYDEIKTIKANLDNAVKNNDATEQAYYESELNRYTRSYEKIKKSITKDVGEITEIANGLYNADGSIVDGYEADVQKLNEIYATYKALLVDEDNILGTKVSSILDSTFVEQKEQLKELALQGGLSVDVLKAKFPQLVDSLGNVKVSAEDAVDQIQKLCEQDPSTLTGQLKNIFIGAGNNTEDTNKYLEGKSDEEIQLLYTIVHDEGGRGLSFSELDDEINNRKNKPINLDVGVTQDNIEKLEKFKTLMGNIKTALSKEDLDSDTIIDLMNQMPDADWSSYLDGTRSLKEILGELANNEMSDLVDENESLQGIMSDLFDDTFKEANASAETLLGTIDKLSGKFSVLQKAYDEMNDKDNPFKTLDFSTLQTMEEAFGKMDGWKDFYSLATSGTATVKELQDAMSGLATEAIDNSALMANLTNANKDYVATELEKLGIVNAEEVVQDRLNAINQNATSALSDLTNAKMVYNMTSEDLVNMSGQELMALYNECVQAGVTSEALYNLAMQKLNANNTTLDTSGDCSNANALANTANYTAESVNLYGNEKIIANRKTIDTQGDVSNMNVLGRQSVYATQQLNAMGNEKIATNQKSVNTSGDIANCVALANAATKAMAALANMKNRIAKSNDLAAADNAERIIREHTVGKTSSSSSASYSNVSPVTISAGGGSAKNGSGGSKTSASSAKYTPVSSSGGSSKNGGTSGGSGGSKYKAANYKSPTKTNSSSGGSGGGKGGSSKSKSSKSGSGSSKSTKDAFEKIYDNITTLVENLQSKIDAKMETIDDNSSESAKLKAYKKANSYYQEQYNAYKNGKEYYKKQMSKIKFSKSEKKTLQKVLSGDISVSTIKNEKLADKIDQYVELNEKANDCSDGMRDCTASIRENLAAIDDIKMDKITRTLDNLDYKMEKIEKYSDLRSARGNTTTTKDYEYRELKSLSNQRISALKEENAILEKQNKSLSKTSETYQDNLAKIRDNNLAIRDCQISQAEWNKELANMKINAIDTVIERLQTAKSLTDAINEYREAKGETLGKSDYEKEIKDNKKEIEQIQKKAKLYEYYSKMRQNGSITKLTTQQKKDIESILGSSIELQDIPAYVQEINSKSTGEWANMNKELMIDVYKLLAENENLADEIIEGMLNEKYTKKINEIETLIGDYEHQLNMLDDDKLFSKNGEMTEDGIKKQELLKETVSALRGQYIMYSEQLKQINKLYKDGQLTEDQYKEKLEDVKDGIFDTESALKDASKELEEFNKQQMQLKIDAWSELVDKQKESLSSAKEYNDYMKNLKKQTDERNYIQSQIDALEATEDSIEKQAKMAQLNKQLKEADEAIAETKEEHMISAIEDGLDDFITDMQESLDNGTEEICDSLQEIRDILGENYLVYDPSNQVFSNVSNGNQISRANIATANAAVRSQDNSTNFNSPLLVIENIEGANTADVMRQVNKLVTDMQRSLITQLNQLKK